MMSGKTIIFAIIVLLFTLVGVSSAFNLPELLNIAKQTAKALGTEESGKIERGNGCIVNWSYKGTIRGIKWKYIGICVDSCTGESATSLTDSRNGAIEHCLQDLFQKLSAKQEL